MRALCDRRRAEGMCPYCGKQPPAEGRRMCPDCTASRKKINDKSRAKAKTETIAHYGGECVCCGEKEPAFLTLDHINNDGAEHRRNTSYRSMMAYARHNGYPPDLQLMCWNCNLGKHINGGVCPHGA